MAFLLPLINFEIAEKHNHQAVHLVEAALVVHPIEWSHDEYVHFLEVLLSVYPMVG